MSESKEYVSQTLENGAIHVSAEVLASLAALAVTEVEGVYSLNNAIASKKSVGRGIRVVVSDENTVSVDCYVIAIYGYSVVELARAVQDAVSGALESTTGVRVTAVNVGISGICHPKATKK